MVLWLALATLWLLALGFAVARLALGPERRVLCIALAPGLGMACAGLLCFGLHVVGAARLQLPLELVVVLVAAVGMWRGSSRERDKGEGPSPARPLAQRVLLWLLLGICALLLAGAALAFVRETLAHPFGTGDAIDIWNLRARFLHRAEDWRAAFAPALAWSHPDYPPLVPMAIVRLWQLTGAESAAAGAIVAAGFSLSVPLCLAALLRERLGAVPAAIGAALLLATPRFFHWGAAQYADVPLAFGILVAVALLSDETLRARPRRGALVLAGLAAGLAAFTKNEGQLFAAILAALFAWVSSGGPGRPRTAALRRLGLPLLLGAAVPLAALAWFKLALAPANDLLSQSAGGDPLVHAQQLSRYRLVLEHFATGIATIGHGLPLLLVLVAFVLPAGRPRAPRLLRLLPLATLLCVLLGYAAVYVLLSPHLQWHLPTSLERLLLGLWPLAIFAVLHARLAPAGARP